MRLFITYFLLLVSVVTYGQTDIDLDEEKSFVEMALSNRHTMDSLVSNALVNSYKLKSLQAEVDQRIENVSVERKSWLSTFQMGVNFFSINTTMNAENQAITTASLLPNIGVILSINPEKIISRGNRIKMAQQDVVRLQQALNEERRIIRVFITNKFYEYLEALKIIELRQQAYQNLSDKYDFISLRFTRGEANANELMLAEGGLVDAEEALSRAQIMALKIKSEITFFTSDTESGNFQNP